MGRPYAREMDELPDVYEWAIASDISRLERFVGRAAGRPLYAVGFGGSQTAATLAAVLHRQAGSPACTMTPMELVHGGDVDGSVSVLLATSGGNNVDIVAAFKAAAERRGRNVCVLSAGGAGDGGRAGRLASGRRSALVHSAAVPTGGDGFLATASVIASCAWLARAYAVALGRGRLPLPAEYGRLGVSAPPDPCGIEASGSLLVLHDVWGKAAAVDIESKMAESGMAAVQVADYRNFGHGRHHGIVAGLAARPGIVALVSPLSRDLADRTVSQIPRTVPVCRIDAGMSGPAAAVSLVASAMVLVGSIAASRGVDPGRPRVAGFGRRLYSMPMEGGGPAAAAATTAATAAPSPLEATALRKKFGNADARDPWTMKRLAALRRFTGALSSQRFGGVVIDYDDALCGSVRRAAGPSKGIAGTLSRILAAGVTVGMATGRGGSVRKELSRAIPERLRAGVVIGYHNGAEVSRMADPPPDSPGPPPPAELRRCIALIRRRGLLPAGTRVSKRRGQVSLAHGGIRAAPLARSLGGTGGTGGTGSGSAGADGARVVEAGRSVYLLARGTSRTNLYEEVSRAMPPGRGVLCIGARGGATGSDGELLGTGYSLTVDEPSDDPESCWNLLPWGVSGEAGASEYMGWLSASGGCMRMQINRRRGGRRGRT